MQELDDITRMNGEYLASLARRGAAKGVNCGKMCHECAFRTDQTNLDGYPLAVEGALTQLMWDGDFNCHTPDYQDAKKLCVGFLYAQQAMNSIMSKVSIMNNLNLDPIADQVLVLPAKVEEKTAAGIYIPETAKQRSLRGTVVATGPGRRNVAGDLVPMQVRVGEEVFYSKSASGETITLEDQEYLIMKETSILASVKKRLTAEENQKYIDSLK